ncbi:conserved hypothetical protein [Candidatus Contendobacter odensis Run_B_J11]|uniref:DUF3018 family protein n=2 Tax=Candidatus Contendibacter odensensis TaxID=1400860 RepID=A0A7U7G814_9GAMM|nr:conserved hypothetical protein [Candidatus Contendobacter odensis Run_B_J11]
MKIKFHEAAWNEYLDWQRTDKALLRKVNLKRGLVMERVQKRRDALRRAGLRPVQIWVPDTRRPGFDEECRRQSQRAAQSDLADTELLAAMEEILTDVDSWTP